MLTIKFLVENVLINIVILGVSLDKLYMFLGFSILLFVMDSAVILDDYR
jgi:hypothetical protein